MKVQLMLLKGAFVCQKKKINFTKPNTNGFSATESREVSFNGNVYIFLVEYNSIEISDILIVHMY